MNMEIQKLPKTLFDRAIALKVDEIHLNFSGGSDEGYLNVNLIYNGEHNSQLGKLERDIENWAWDVYSYNGAGDGSDYGDDIVYDLVNKRAVTTEWYTARQEGPSEAMDLAVDDETSDTKN